MSVYALWARDEFSVLPLVLVGWDDDQDFFIEIGWLNFGLGVVFG